jgi:hypothetical protein
MKSFREDSTGGAAAALMSGRHLRQLMTAGRSGAFAGSGARASRRPPRSDLAQAAAREAASDRARARTVRSTCAGASDPSARQSVHRMSMDRDPGDAVMSGRSGTFESAIGILAEQAIAFLADFALLPREQTGGRLRPAMPRLAVLRSDRFLRPGGGGGRGDGTDILELRAGGPVAMKGFLGPAQAG